MMIAAKIFAVGILLVTQAGTPPPQKPMKENRAPVAAPPAPLDEPTSAGVDRTFAVALTEGNAAELDLAHLAMQRGSANEIKAFAGKMISEHEGLMNEMNPAIVRFLDAGTPTDRLSPFDQLARQHLEAVSPPDFDQGYAMSQIAGHLAMLTAFETEADNGTDPQLKQLARKWLPTIKAHLEMAVNLTQHIGGASPFKSH